MKVSYTESDAEKDRALALKTIRTVAETAGDPEVRLRAADALLYAVSAAEHAAGPEPDED